MFHAVKISERRKPMTDGTKVEILKNRGTVNPLDPNDKSGDVKLHDYNVGEVVTLNTSKANLFISNGWAKQVA
jgi:hypothetical protein